MMENSSRWRVVRARVTGTSHHKTGQPCQDAFADDRVADLLIVAVADGAGSAERSGEGSQVAATRAVEAVRVAVAEGRPNQLHTDPNEIEQAWTKLIRQAFEQARLAVAEIARAKEQATLRDFATTLSLVVASDRWWASGVIGDTMAVSLNEAGELTSLCEPQRGEYANMTNFLTQDNALDLLDIQVQAQTLTGLAVFSDGLAALAMNLAQNKPHQPFFKPLFAFIEAVDGTAEAEDKAATQLAEFLDSERVNQRTDDDKTLVLARRVV